MNFSVESVASDSGSMSRSDGPTTPFDSLRAALDDLGADAPPVVVLEHGVGYDVPPSAAAASASAAGSVERSSADRFAPPVPPG